MLSVENLPCYAVKQLRKHAILTNCLYYTCYFLTRLPRFLPLGLLQMYNRQQIEII